MNRYQKENAVSKIAGYFLPRPHETALGKRDEAFERAKQEAIQHMRDALEHVEAISAEEYFSQVKKISISSRIVDQGITYRQYLIAHAPAQIPATFKPQQPPKITLPKPEDHLSPDQIQEWEEEEDESKWSEAVREFDNLWQVTMQKIEESEAKREVPMYAKWPIAWADAIIDLESQEVDAHAESAE